MLRRNHYGSMGEANTPANATTAAAAEFVDQWREVPFDTTLTANQEKTDLSLFFFSDGDYYVTNLRGLSTGDFEINFQLPDGAWVSSARLRKANIIGTAAAPYPVFPAQLVPKGSKIGIQIKDLSGSSNTVQLVFGGFRRIYLR